MASVTAVERRGDRRFAVRRHGNLPARLVGAEALRLHAFVDDARVAPEPRLDEVDGDRLRSGVGQGVAHLRPPAVAAEPSALLDNGADLDVERLSGRQAYVGTHRRMADPMLAD